MKINWYNLSNFYLSNKINKTDTKIQKYSHIFESYAFILKIFVVKTLFSITFLISFGICSTAKLPKYVKLSPFTYKAIQ